MFGSGLPRSPDTFGDRPQRKDAAADQQSNAGVRPPTRADNDPLFGQVFGREDAANLRAGMALNPTQAAAALASPAAVRANQSLFFGKDGMPLSVAQLYSALAAGNAPPQRPQGENAAGSDPLQLLRVAARLSANPATAEVGRVLMQGAIERMKEAQPSYRPLGANAQRGSVIPEGATATNPQTGERIIFKSGQWQAMP
jgi:hypothetical protein